MKLLLACFLFCVIGAEVAFGQSFEPAEIAKPTFKSKVAFIREYPSVLHKCVATFVSEQFLLTNAACVICGRKCSFYIRAFSDTLTGPNGKTFKVKEVIVHPNYQFDFHDKFDVALVKLEHPVKDMAAYHLPDKINPAVDFPAKIFFWKFFVDLKKFHYHPLSVRKISNALCSTILNEYISDFEICSYDQNQTFSMGPYDLGTPLTTEFNRKEYILGIYNGHYVHDTYVTKFMSIAPFVNWIKSQIHIKHNTDPSEFHPFQPDIPQPDQFQTQQFHSDPYKSFHM